MSVVYEQFTVEVSLQHMSMVRLSAHLLRQLPPKIINLFTEINKPYYDLRSWWRIRHEELKNSIDSLLSETVGTYCIPIKLKKTLSDYISAMGLRMFRCLSRLQRDMMEARDDNHEEKLSYFINNFYWDNFGCIDPQKMIDSYVRDRETIDYATWKQLCNQFSEDNIRRFAADFDFENPELSHTDHSAFWHYQIYKKFPKNFNGGRLPLHRHHRTRQRPVPPERVEEWLIRKLLQKNFDDDNISAFKFFSKQLTEEGFNDNIRGLMYTSVLCISSHPGSANHIISESYVYILGQIKNLKSTVRVSWKRELSNWKMTFFMDWPWVYCVRSWRNIFEAYKQNDEALTKIMLNTFEIITTEREVSSQEMLYIQHCQIFEELWDVWYENSLGADIGRKAIDIGWLALLLKDINLCKVIFRKDDETRMHFLLEVGAQCPLSTIGPVDHDFWRTFMMEVIVNDYERDTFKDMFHHNSMKQPSYIYNMEYEDSSSCDDEI